MLPTPEISTEKTGSATEHDVLIIDRCAVRATLEVSECIDIIERAFRQYADGNVIQPSVVGSHVEGGGFHTKTAGLSGGDGRRSVFAVKVNANFPANPSVRGLPTIQGVVLLFDATDGRPLAILDSKVDPRFF